MKKIISIFATFIIVIFLIVFVAINESEENYMVANEKVNIKKTT